MMPKIARKKPKIFELLISPGFETAEKFRFPLSVSLKLLEVAWLYVWKLVHIVVLNRGGMMLLIIYGLKSLSFFVSGADEPYVLQ